LGEKKLLEAIENVKDAATFAAVGAVVGGVVYHQIGGAGLAIAGGAYPIGLAAFTGAGAVAGLAAHGATKEAIKNLKEAATFATVGAVAGGTVYHQTGAAGLAIAGGAYPVGLAAFVGTGAVAGLAAFGVKKSVFG
jgi:hypothetical protein